MSGIDALLASLPPWTLVGGKGGVGKTTCAAALAIRSARGGVRTLVLSTDPAGTLADVLESTLGGEPRAVAGLDSLWAVWDAVRVAIGADATAAVPAALEG